MFFVTLPSSDTSSNFDLISLMGASPLMVLIVMISILSNDLGMGILRPIGQSLAQQ